MAVDRSLSVAARWRVLVAAPVALVAALPCVLLAQPATPYADLVGRDIKALSPEQIEDYLEGRGMGMAMAAELNGYPGPKHVLELADELELTAEQVAAVQALFAAMREEAVRLGRAIVDRERALEALFASGEARAEAAREELREIARLSGELRFTHLDAHLATMPLLSAEQLARYASLRGYADGRSQGPHEHHPGHGHDAGRPAPGDPPRGR